MRKIVSRSKVFKFALAFAVGFSFADSVALDGAELRIRKSLLEGQKNRALISVSGKFDHVKPQVNSLAKDCDLHAPIKTADIWVAVVGEFMNACATSLDPKDVTKWTANAPAQIQGVFRIWFEHPGKSNEVMSEEEGAPVYTGSNPPHAVEIHPITKVGQKSFLSAIKSVEKDGQFLSANGVQQAKRLKNRKVSVNEYDGKDGEEFVLISSGCCLPNYFHLRGVLKSTPENSEDGTVANINILDGNKAALKDIRLFSIEGTAAHSGLKAMKKGDKFDFWAITRLDLGQVLDAIQSNEGDDMNIPFEFVLLAIAPE